MLLWVAAVEFENTGIVSGKRNVSRVFPKSYGFRFWYTRKWGRRISAGFHLLVLV